MLTDEQIGKMGEQLLKNENFNLIIKSNIEYLIQRQLMRQKQQQHKLNENVNICDITNEIDSTLCSIVKLKVDQEMTALYETMKSQQNKHNETVDKLCQLKEQIEQLKRLFSEKQKNKKEQNSNILMKKLRNQKVSLCESILNKDNKLFKFGKQNVNDEFLQASLMSSRIEQMQKSSLQISKKIAQIFQNKLRKLQQSVEEVKNIIQNNIDANLSSIWNILAQIQQKLQITSETKQVQKVQPVQPNQTSFIKLFYF